MVLDPISVMTRGDSPVGTCLDLSAPVTQEVELQRDLKRRKRRLLRMTPMHTHAGVPTPSETLRDPESGFRVLQWGQGWGVLP